MMERLIEQGGKIINVIEEQGGKIISLVEEIAHGSKKAADNRDEAQAKEQLIEQGGKIISLIKEQGGKIISLIEEIAHGSKKDADTREEAQAKEQLIEQGGKIISLIEEQGGKIISLIEEIAHGSKKDADTRDEASVEKDLDEQTRRRGLKLYRAALNGDWEVAKRIYDVYGCDIEIGINKNNQTSLDIASAGKHFDFVNELMKMWQPENLAKSQALFYAASTGMVELAMEMMKNVKSIEMVPGPEKVLPIEVAALLGHKDMVVHLYNQTNNSLNNGHYIENCKNLLIRLIETELYDVALRLLGDQPDLATSRPKNDKKYETALHALARKNLTSSHFVKKNQRAFFSRCFNLGAKDAENKRKDALKLVESIWEKVVLLKDSEISELISKPEKLIFYAAKLGNFEFLSILIREYPFLIWNVDENNYSIFHTAVLNRQEDIFKLIYEIGSTKDLIVHILKDKECNNILHLAGKLAPQDRLNIVSGAALQMQRELLWFKEVKKVVNQGYAEAKNKKGLTPSGLFAEEHEKLRLEGEKWMKDTATSCMLVATLIATVVFAAAFTVPGGTKGDTGFPFFLEKVSFKIFAISDAISLVFSSVSIVNFLSILTSRYAEEDFVKSLPRKLLFGLFTLFISIAAMMVAFSAAFFVLFNGGRLWIAIMVTVFASIPVILFTLQHYKLFYDVLRSTYVSNSLFKKGKISLFRKQGEASKRQKKTKLCNGRITIQCTGSANV